MRMELRKYGDRINHDLGESLDTVEDQNKENLKILGALNKK